MLRTEFLVMGLFMKYSTMPTWIRAVHSGL